MFIFGYMFCFLLNDMQDCTNIKQENIIVCFKMFGNKMRKGMKRMKSTSFIKEKFVESTSKIV